MKKNISVVLASIAFVTSAFVANAKTMTFDFEEGAFGTYWFDMTASEDGPNINLNFSSENDVVITGNYSLGPADYDDRDKNHAGTLHVRSIPFYLDGSGDLTWNAMAGHASALAPELGTGDMTLNVLGIALTRVSDGERVLSAAINTQTTATITAGSFTAAQLLPFVGESGETWTLDAYDRYAESLGTGNGWESLNLDDIVVPGFLVPEPASIMLCLLGLFGLVMRRKR